MDLKFASNLIQLAMEGIEILETGKIEFPLKYRGDILDIKNGKYSAEEIIEWSDSLLFDAEEALGKTDLPKKPRAKLIEEFAMKEVKDYLLR